MPYGSYEEKIQMGKVKWGKFEKQKREKKGGHETPNSLLGLGLGLGLGLACARAFFPLVVFSFSLSTSLVTVARKKYGRRGAFGDVVGGGP